MQHPQLLRKLNDAEYERRFNRLFLPYLLLLLPPIVLATVTYLQCGVLSLPAVSVAAASYALIIFVSDRHVRAAVLGSMRREGMIDEGYKPPLF
jgi:hypothetical protein